MESSSAIIYLKIVNSRTPCICFPYNKSKGVLRMHIKPHRFKRGLAGLLCLCLMAGTAGCKPASTTSSTPSTSAESSVPEESGSNTQPPAVNNDPLVASFSKNIGGQDMQLNVYEFTPNTPAERSFIHKDNGSGFVPFGTKFVRITDMQADFVYKFTGEIGQKAYIILDLSQEYVLEMSADAENWTTVTTYEEGGRFREYRGFDLTEYFKDSDTAYVRMSDAVKGDGWGGQIAKVTYVTLTGAPEDGNLFEDISQGWTCSAGGAYAAGTPVSAAAGEKVTFTREYTVPAYWFDHDLGLTFSWIESDGTPTVKINGKAVEPTVKWGYNLVLPIDRELAGQKITIEVETTATKEGKTGLWNSIRTGFTDLITLPQNSWTLGDETRVITHNYFPEGGNDLVLLNSLAGNLMTTLFDTRHGLSSFDGLMRERDMFYAHDTSRSIIALADEERYSPVVRLDAIREFYNGVVNAMVPGSDYEIFMKRDNRGKPLVKSDTNPRRLIGRTQQDMPEPFTDMYITADDINLGSISCKDTPKATGDGLNRICSFGENGKINVDVTWYDGTAAKPTTAKISAENADTYNVVFDNFNKRFYMREMAYIVDGENKILTQSTDGKTELEVPEEGFFFLRSNNNAAWHPCGILFTWDKKPTKILLKAAKDKSGYESITFVYEGSQTSTMTALPFMDFDSSCAWPLQVAKNIKANGTYGTTNGYDPTYICGAEGLGTGAFAAAAYIFKKYGDPLAEEAEQRAIKAMDAAVEASKRGSMPVLKYDRVAACDYLVKMGHEEYKDVARYWADLVVAEQDATGAFYWLDARCILTVQRTYEITGDQKYLDSINKYRSAITYTPTAIHYKGEAHKQFITFAGAGEYSWLGHMGDMENLENVFAFADTVTDDSGVFDCSDLNPYFLGWSLKGVMEKQYSDSDMKQVLKKGEFALYKTDGSVTLLDYPTAYVNNPNSIHN